MADFLTILKAGTVLYSLMIWILYILFGVQMVRKFIGFRESEFICKIFSRLSLTIIFHTVILIFLALFNICLFFIIWDGYCIIISAIYIFMMTLLNGLNMLIVLAFPFIYHKEDIFDEKEEDMEMDFVFNDDTSCRH